MRCPLFPVRIKIHLAPFALRGDFCQYFIEGVAKIKKTLKNRSNSYNQSLMFLKSDIKGIIFITFLVVFSVSFVASQEVKCDAKCICPRIYMPVCNSAGMKLADNDCIANCYREKCGSKFTEKIRSFDV